MYEADADTDSAYNQLSYNKTTSVPQADPNPNVLYTTDMIPNLQSAGQVVHNENWSQSAPFIQLSYVSHNWQTIDPSLYLGVPHHSTDMISDVRLARQDINGKPDAFILDVLCLCTPDPIQNEHDLQRVPLIQPLYHQ